MEYFHKITSQAYERAIDVENEFVTSEIESSYPQSSKDMVHNVREPPQTTLYELLEYAKNRSILKNCNSNSSVGNNHGSFVIRSLNSVQFNQNQPANENSSIKSNKKIPIRISSLKRETKTAQTLRYVHVHFFMAQFRFVSSSNSHHQSHQWVFLFAGAAREHCCHGMAEWTTLIPLNLQFWI